MQKRGREINPDEPRKEKRKKINLDLSLEKGETTREGEGSQRENPPKIKRHLQKSKEGSTKKEKYKSLKANAD